MHKSGNTKNWLRYWRNSLADAEAGRGAINKKNLRSHISVNVAQFQQGTLQNDANSELNKENLKILFAGEPEKTRIIKALIRPVIYISKYEHGQKHTSSRPDVLSPIICHVWISRNGKFYPAGKPTVPRDLLSPQDDDKFTLYSVDDLDAFQTQNEIQVFNEQEAQALAENELIPGKQYQEWEQYYKLAQTLFTALNSDETKLKLSAGYLPEKNKKTYLIKTDDAINTSRNILRLYDWLQTKNENFPLLENFALGKVTKFLPCLDQEKSISCRLGHSNSNFPLAKAQKDALAHMLHMKEGEILAVNGPPGTGKTTFVLSAVASLWIKAALKKADPPIIIAASTNNQAVTNIIAAFGKDFEENDSLFSGRWIPEQKSYGGYFPAASKESEASPFYQTKSFYESMEQSEFIDRSESIFIRKAKAAFKNTNLDSIEIIQKTLHQSMLDLQDTLLQIKNAWETLSTAHNRCLEAMGEDPKNSYLQVTQNLEAAEKMLRDVRSDQKSWRIFLSKEPVFYLIFRWLPPVARKLLLLRNVFIETKFSDLSKSVIRNVDNVEEELLSWIQAKENDLSALKKDKEYKAALIKEWITAQQNWRSVTNHIAPGLTDLPNITSIDDILDTSVRFQLFQLSVHYWEAQWLIECRKMQEEGGTDWAGSRKTGKKSVLPRWRRRMMLTPCIVSTLHSLPSHMVYQAHSGGEKFNDEYLAGEIDLLIVDEAGQVSPEVAAASFSLAKSALIIGDIHQIEPIRSLTGSIDTGNLIQYEVMSSKEQYPEVLKTGNSVINGSVMRIAQRASRYCYIKGAEPGMFLREHRRCYDEIISFSNDLCYQGLLEPKRGSAPRDPLFPPMSYLHIDGLAEAPPTGSRHNVLEAIQVAKWLADNRENIEGYYQQKGGDYQGKKLEDLVGIITPFKAQQEKIERVCVKNGIHTGKGESKLIVGTVHALQGAERPIIIFSVVYSRHSDGDFIDIAPSMLNVAVSRAKDSFIVFGDMDVISGAGRGKPRNILARYLFSSDSNELILPVDERPDLLKSSVTPKLINNAVEHDEYIRQILRKANSRIDMVSPWISIQRLKETGLYPEILDALRRGVSISIYTDYHFNSTSMNHYDESKASLFAQNCETLCEIGVDVYVVNGVHSKLIMADNSFLSVGSYNWASAARTGKYANMETSMIYSGDLNDEISLQIKSLKERIRMTHLSKGNQNTSREI